MDYRGYGSVMALMSQGILVEIISCFFINNSATYKGGILFSLEGNDIQISNTTFINCSATHGGVLATELSANKFNMTTKLLIEGCLVQNIKSLGNGAGFAIETETDLVLRDSSFEVSSLVF